MSPLMPDVSVKKFPAPAISKYPHFLLSLLLIAAVSAVCAHTLNSPFVFDDLPNIVHNEFIRIKNMQPETLVRVWQAPHPSRKRPLAYLTFALNYHWDGYHPAGYHIVNILIHAGCGLLTALFFCQMLKSGWLGEKYGPAGPWLAWGAAFIWVLHPIQINAVTYIVQRMTSLAVFFALLSVTAWQAGRKRWLRGHYPAAFICWGFSGGAWIAGLLCKEHVAVVPLLLLSLEFLFRKGDFRIKWRWTLPALLAVTAIVFLYMGPEPWRSVLGGYRHRDFTLSERLMTQSRVLWHYLSLFFFPLSDRFTLIYDYPVSRSLWSPLATLAGIIAWAGLVITAWAVRKRLPVFTWMAGWFLISHLTESTVIPLEIIFEHRMYLPSVALALGFVLMAYDLLAKKISVRILFFLYIVCLLTVAASTFVRNADYRDEVSLYRSELKKYPNSKRNQLSLASALIRSGNPEGSELLKNMAKEFPTDMFIQQNWFSFLAVVRRDTQAAEAVYQHIVNLLEQGHYRPREDASPLWKIAEYYFDTGNYERALFLADYLLKNYAHYPFIWFFKGQCHLMLGNTDSALHAFHQAWLKKPDDKNILYWYGKLLIQKGEKDRGCELLEEAGRTEDEKLADAVRNLIKSQCRKPQP